MSTTLLLDSSQTTGNSANFSVHYNPPIELDPTKQYEIGMISCTCWNAMANVKTGVNDEFRYTVHRKNPLLEARQIVDVILHIPQGAYNIEDLNKVIKELMIESGDNADEFELTANYNKLLARITVGKLAEIDFKPPRTIASLLGFPRKSYGFTSGPKKRVIDGEFPVNITEVNTILVNCSIASGSYTSKGSKGQTIYSFSPDVPPGSIMQITPRQVIYYPINLENQIPSITMQLTDQSGRQLDFNNETVTYYLHLRTTA